MKKNIDIVRAWLRGEKAKNGRMTSSGDTLFSYRVPIGVELLGFGKIAVNHTASTIEEAKGSYISQTTSQHVGLTYRELKARRHDPNDTIILPVDAAMTVRSLSGE